jgi:hypothetical protein
VEIKSISNKERFLGQINSNKPESAQNSGGIDKLEISGEGKILFKSELNNLRLQVIRGRIESKYFNSDEVFSRIADKIYNEIK